MDAEPPESVLNLVRASYASREVRELVCRILFHTYEAAFGRLGTEFLRSAFSEMIESMEQDNEAMRRAYLITRSRFTEMGLRRVYQEEFRRRNLFDSIRVIGEHQFQGNVVDVGCDDNALCSLIAGRVESVLGLDTRRVEGLNEAAPFRLVGENAGLPLEDEATDTCILRYTLHHVAFAEQAILLSECHRALTPGGRLLVFENSFDPDFQEACEDPLRILSEVGALHEQGRLLAFLNALDMFSLTSKNKRGPFPGSFRLHHDWQNTLVATGFAVEARFVGYPILDLHQAPLSVFTCTKR